MTQSPANRNEFQNAERIQENLLSTLEKRCLLWLAERMPAWINSDHLTLLGMAGMCLAGLAYAFAQVNPLAPLVASFWLFVNWFGDSLDGTLARVRNRQRPRYGFYVDHVVDMFAFLALMGGLAFSGYMEPWIATAFLVVYYMLSIDIYLATYTIGKFRMSFWIFGPTELRLFLIAGNCVLLFHPMVHLFGQRYRAFDVGGVCGIVVMLFILVFSVVRNTVTLYRAERLKGSLR